MSEYKLRVVLMDEALSFVRSLPLKVQQKITYNYKKIEQGVMDKELFKKLENSEIWEFRTLFNGNLLSPFFFLGHGNRHFGYSHTWHCQKVTEDTTKRNYKG